MRRLSCWSAGAILVAFALFTIASSSPLDAAEQLAADPAGGEFFEKKIRPVLIEHCYRCHSAEAKKPKGGLRLDSRAGLLQGGDNGPALVPGQPDKSRLIEAICYANVELRMPPKGKLPDPLIANFTAWVKMGAPWPATEAPKTVVKSKGDFDLAQRKRDHWSWQPIRSPAPPEVKDASWPRHPVDRFILSKLETKGLTPAPSADKRTLLRRVYFDLIGLPPAPAELAVFVQDQSSNAFDKVVDRLLNSEHFGERWGRHWLDLVRYAETRGHEFDYVAPNAYQYRDYVIRALNADVPYNQFVTEHIAGDLLQRPRLHPREGFNESILGTGFWFLGEEVHSPVDVRQDEADRFDNRIDVLTKTFLGLTVSCARCHDHKFDAISTKDYYALYGFLKSSSYRLARLDSMETNRRIAAELHTLREQYRPGVQKAVAESMRSVADRLADYLLAARAVVQGGKIETIAEARQLNQTVLNEWVAHVKTAVKDGSDPFHFWAKAAVDSTTHDPKRLAELRQPLVDTWRKQQAESAATLEGAEVIVDYSKLRPDQWLPDDVTFRAAPVQPGQIRWSSDPQRPFLKVFDYAAAEKDPTWNGLKLAPGAENDPGPVGGVVRSGRTIRTPTFKVTGKVFYRVKGMGRMYAAVDQHVLINGPLHGRLLQPIKTGEQFQWLGIDLTTYQGNYAHLEFTAIDNSDFAVAQVVQEAATPPTLDRPNERLLKLLSNGEDAGSLEKLAAGYQRLFADVIERLAKDQIIGSVDAVAVAQLANWMVRHPDLMRTDEGSANQRVVDAASPLLTAQAKLTTQIKTESRLAMAMLDGSGADEYVFIRGSPRAAGEVVPRRFLEALAGSGKLPVARGSGRLELARLMTDPSQNPFLTRVLVNRVWHHLFGRGIVASVDNFGVMGEAPTHPELLDYLAGQFVQEGWSIKQLIRSLVTSSSYRMSSQAGGPADQVDSQNLLLHRMNLRRLEGEVIRDAMLLVSGRLDRKLYGPSVLVYLTEFQQGRGRPPSGPLDGAGRRSIYLAIRRNFLSSMMLAFDTPIPFSTVGKRTVSNVPAQSLILMNDPMVHLQADLWARRVLEESNNFKDRINAMYQSAFARSPTETELAACLDFLEQQAKIAGQKSEEVKTWADLAHALFNVKEFVYLK